MVSLVHLIFYNCIRQLSPALFSWCYPASCSSNCERQLRRNLTEPRESGSCYPSLSGEQSQCLEFISLKYLLSGDGGCFTPALNRELATRELVLSHDMGSCPRSRTFTSLYGGILAVNISSRGGKINGSLYSSSRNLLELSIAWFSPSLRRVWWSHSFPILSPFVPIISPINIYFLRCFARWSFPCIVYFIH